MSYSTKAPISKLSSTTPYNLPNWLYTACESSNSTASGAEVECASPFTGLPLGGWSRRPLATGWAPLGHTATLSLGRGYALLFRLDLGADADCNA